MRSPTHPSSAFYSATPGKRKTRRRNDNGRGPTVMVSVKLVLASNVYIERIRTSVSARRAHGNEFLTAGDYFKFLRVSSRLPNEIATQSMHFSVFTLCWCMCLFVLECFRFISLCRTFLQSFNDYNFLRTLVR